MLIESLIKRERGTIVTLPGAAYTFQPDEAGRHVAQVEDEAHAAVLLAIPEGYRAVSAPAKAAATNAQPTAAPVVPKEPVDTQKPTTQPTAAPKHPTRKAAAKTEVA